MSPSKSGHFGPSLCPLSLCILLWIFAQVLRAAHKYVEKGGTCMEGVGELHGITGPMAYLDMLHPLLDVEHHRQALSAFNRTHAKLLKDYQPKPGSVKAIPFPDLTTLRTNPAAITGPPDDAGGEGHMFKLMDALVRAHSRSGGSEVVFCHAAVKAMRFPEPKKSKL